MAFLVGSEFLDRIIPGERSVQEAIDLLDPSVGPDGPIGVKGSKRGPGYFGSSYWRETQLKNWIQVRKGERSLADVADSIGVSIPVLRARVAKVNQFISWVSKVHLPKLGAAEDSIMGKRERRGLATLTHRNHNDIAMDPRPYRAIAREFGISAVTVMRIKHRAALKGKPTA